MASQASLPRERQLLPHSSASMLSCSTCAVFQNVFYRSSFKYSCADFWGIYIYTFSTFERTLSEIKILGLEMRHFKEFSHSEIPLRIVWNFLSNYWRSQVGRPWWEGWPGPGEAEILYEGTKYFTGGHHITSSFTALVETWLIWPWRVKITQTLQKSLKLLKFGPNFEASVLSIFWS